MGHTQSSWGPSEMRAMTQSQSLTLASHLDNARGKPTQHCLKTLKLFFHLSAARQAGLSLMHNHPSQQRKLQVEFLSPGSFIWLPRFLVMHPAARSKRVGKGVVFSQGVCAPSKGKTLEVGWLITGQWSRSRCCHSSLGMSGLFQWVIELSQQKMCKNGKSFVWLGASKV